MYFFFCESTTVRIPSQHIMKSLKTQITETVLWEGWRPPANIAPCKYEVLELYLPEPVNTLHDLVLPNLIAENYPNSGALKSPTHRNHAS